MLGIGATCTLPSGWRAKLGDKRQPVYASSVPSDGLDRPDVSGDLLSFFAVADNSLWITNMQDTNLRYERALASGLSLTPENAPPTLNVRRSERTVRIICQRYNSYRKWTVDRSLTIFPAEPKVLIRFIEDRADKGGKFNTVRAYLWAISAVHKALQLPDPTRDPEVWESAELIRRKQEGQRQQSVVTLSEDDIGHILSVLEFPRRTKFGWVEEGRIAKERAAVDAALLLTMTQAALRRSEAQSLTWGDIRRYPDGTGRITIPSGRISKHVPKYVVAVTSDCLQALEVIRPDGAADDLRVFGISPTQLIKRLKAMCESAGIDPEHVNAYTPRESLIQIMVESGAPFDLIQRQARLRSSSSTVQAFIWDEEAGEALDWMFQPS